MGTVEVKYKQSRSNKAGSITDPKEFFTEIFMNSFENYAAIYNESSQAAKDEFDRVIGEDTPIFENKGSASFWIADLEFLSADELQAKMDAVKQIILE